MIIEWDGKFEWDDDFEWHENIHQAKMKPGKTTQVFNHCTKKLIPSLNERRAWVHYVRALNPGRAEILLPEFHEEHYFKYIGRWFVLEHDAKKKLWRLCFLRFVKDQPPGDDAGAPEEDGVDAHVNAQIEPNERPGDDETNDGAALRVGSAETLRLLAASYSCAQRRISHWRRGLLVAKWNFLDAVERAQDHVMAACAALRLRRRKVAASLSALVRQLREEAIYAPRQVATLQPQRISIGGSRTLEVFVYVPQLRQGAWHCGEPARLDLAMR